MPHYLVTGGAGFIGSHIVERLVKDGHSVRVIDNFSSGKRANLAPFGDKVELLEGDIRDRNDCRRACEGIEIIFHQAAVPSVPKSVDDPVTSHEANIDGTFNLLLAARDAGCRRVIYAASSSAYGDAVELPKRETARPEPLSPYAVNKLVGEYYCKIFSCCYGLQTVALRYFNVFGPRQDPKSQYAAAIPAFVTAILRDEPPTIYGDGEQTRDFTYIDNVVHANLLAANAPKVNGEVVNIACGERVSVNQIIRQINELLGRNVKPKYVPERPGDVKHSLADITAARELIGYQPLVSFEDGLRRAIEWYRKNL
ncbi:MAG TPA: SDR family oxidoreductase [Phycisphaerae bacterium]|jgi:nucleoside-diphosphate-sugar epimerase|nr:SDR family oxidoreductase [Phycisphaerae bacterium]HOB75815.1 SDR family oxidoreductase [Phycisphaerae bacterium]HOJ54558.1 SDR family oxidoreductase [Phycisphaerae bacterium]HOL27049.1 SDR family oxidoreductase [Phycisphaerae bacterium]HPP22153.1 SDR family oxidoreductase [Phycisphaerae bacterium]